MKELEAAAAGTGTARRTGSSTETHVEHTKIDMTTITGGGNMMESKQIKAWRVWGKPLKNSFSIVVSTELGDKTSI